MIYSGKNIFYQNNGNIKYIYTGKNYVRNLL